MSRHTRLPLILIAVLAALAAFIVAPIPNKPKLLSGFRINPGIDLAGGAELRYKVLFDPGFKGDKAQVTALASDVIRRRLEARLLKEPKISSYGDDQIVVQLPGVDADGLEDCKRLIRRGGKLGLHASAPAELQNRYDQDKIVPEGYRAVQDRGGAPFLIRETPVIEGRHILHAEPQQVEESGGIRWVTSFVLDAEGAKLFDDAAGELYRRRPRGRMAILLDGEVRSAPAIESPAFHGRGQISGTTR